MKLKFLTPILALAMLFAASSAFAQTPPIDLKANPYTQNFESYALGEIPTGGPITIINNNSDTRTWQIISAGHNSTKNITYTYNSSVPANDYFILPKMHFEAGKTYTIKWWVSNSENYPESYKLMYGTDATVTALTNTIATYDTVLTISGYVLYSVNFTPTNTQDLHIAFHCFSKEDMNFLNIDDISIEEAKPTITTLPMVYNFDGSISDFVIKNNNNEGAMWFHVNDSLIYNGDNRNTHKADDWFIFPKIHLKAGRDYVFTIQYNETSNHKTNKMKVMYSKDINNLNNLLIDINNITNNYFKDTTATFTAPSDGDYYIGLYCYTDISNQNSLIVRQIGIYDCGVVEKFPYVRDFSISSPCDNIIDKDGDGNTWTNLAEYKTPNGTETQNDYFILQPMKLKQNTTYHLISNYTTKDADINFKQKIKILCSTSPTDFSTAKVITDKTTTNASLDVNIDTTFEVQADGTYYIVMQNYSPPGQGILDFKDIVIAECKTITEYPYSNNFQFNFFTCEKVINQNNDDKIWGSQAGSSIYESNTSEAANDYLILEPMLMTKNATYKLQFNYGISDVTKKHKLKVCFGTSPDSAALTNVIFKNENINAPYSLDTFFSVPNDGVYYIAFHVYSNANQGNVGIGNIVIRECKSISTFPYINGFNEENGCYNINNWTNDINNEGKTGGAIYIDPSETDNHFMLPEFVFEQDVEYKLSFWASNDVDNEKQKLAIVMGSNPANLTDTIFKREDITNTTKNLYLKYDTSFTVSTAGNYYLAFTCYSPSTNYFINIDDFSIVACKGSMPFVHSFEATETDCNSIIDKNADTHTWTYENDAAKAHSGTYYLQYNSSSATTTGNDMLVFPYFNLESKKYDILFWNKREYSNKPHKVRVLFSKNADMSDSTVVLELSGDQIKDAWNRDSASFDIASAGKYYIAFQCVSEKGNGLYFLDDVAIKEHGTIIGVSEAEKEAIFIMPNPASYKLYISAEGLQRVELYSISGNKVGDYGDQNVINVSDISEGLYLIRVYTDKAISTKKIIIRR